MPRIRAGTLGNLMSARNLHIAPLRSCPSSRAGREAMRGSVSGQYEKGVLSFIAYQSYNYAMRMGNISHTRIMIPQIWNMMLSNGLR